MQLIVSLGLGFEGITLGRKSGALQIAMVNGCAREAKTAAFRARVTGGQARRKTVSTDRTSAAKRRGGKKINKQLLGLRGKRRVEEKKWCIYI